MLRREYEYFRNGLILFAYLHLAAEPGLTKVLLDQGVTAISRGQTTRKVKVAEVKEATFSQMQGSTCRRS